MSCIISNCCPLELEMIKFHMTYISKHFCVKDPALMMTWFACLPIFIFMCPSMPYKPCMLVYQLWSTKLVLVSFMVTAVWTCLSSLCLLRVQWMKPHGGSVGSLPDPWPLCRDKTSGCPAMCWWSRLELHLPALQFRVCLLLLPWHAETTKTQQLGNRD